MTSQTASFLRLIFKLVFDVPNKLTYQPSQMPEEEAFCVLVELMEHYRMREFFKPSMRELSLNLYVLSELIQVSMFNDMSSYFIRLYTIVSMYYAMIIMQHFCTVVL